MMKYSVSVIIPMYNAESTIEQVIDSVLEQTAVERVKEIIIVNDGSRDCSEQKVLDKIKEVKNIPIIYRYQENRGVSSARNEGMRIARGELIALLDSDDLWHADKLERQLEIFDHYPEVCFWEPVIWISLSEEKVELLQPYIKRICGIFFGAFSLLRRQSCLSEKQ